MLSKMLQKMLAQHLPGQSSKQGYLATTMQEYLNNLSNVEFLNL